MRSFFVQDRAFRFACFPEDDLAGQEPRFRSLLFSEGVLPGQDRAFRYRVKSESLLQMLFAVHASILAGMLTFP